MLPRLPGKERGGYGLGTNCKSGVRWRRMDWKEWLGFEVGKRDLHFKLPWWERKAGLAMVAAVMGTRSDWDSMQPAVGTW